MEIDPGALRRLVGFAGSESHPVTARVVSAHEIGAAVIEDLILDCGDTEPIPALLTRPKETRGRMPAVLCCHAHGHRPDIGRRELVDGRPALKKPLPCAAPCSGFSMVLPAEGDRPMSGNADDPLYRDPDLAQFYDLENGWSADFDYCAGLARDAASVLDLGCGTGELAAALAEDRAVTGVDPAGAMLDIARQREGGAAVSWVQADARSVRLDRRFDLVLLTGHAFQVFLARENQAAVLATIAAHLAPDGPFIFDSRNPAFRAWEKWTLEASMHTLDHPRLGAVEAWNDCSYDDRTDVLTYSNSYRVKATGKVYSATAQIRFTPQEELAGLIEAAGLAADRWLGDWQGNPFHPEAKEIIPIGQLA